MDQSKSVRYSLPTDAMTSDASEEIRIEPSASIRRSLIDDPEVLSEESSGALDSVPSFVAPLVVTSAVFIGVMVIYKTWRDAR